MYFTQGLHRAFQKYPNKIATICEGRQNSFATLLGRVGSFAAGLRALAGDSNLPNIAILALNSDYYLETLLSVAWLGGVSVPLNTRWSESEIQFALQDSDVEILIVDEAFGAMSKKLRQACPALRVVIKLGVSDNSDDFVGAQRLIESNSPIEDLRQGGDCLLGIFYTGGTTGRSKGVMLSHNNLCSSAMATLATGVFNTDSVGLHLAPMFHLADMLMLTSLLISGSQHIILPAFSPVDTLSLIEQYKVTDTLVVPAMLGAIVHTPTIEQTDLSSLQHVLYGASPAPTVLLEKTMSVMPAVNLMQGYGMTESGALISFLSPEAHRDEGNSQRLKAAGQAAMDVEVRIVDEDDNEVKREQVGEIVCRGPNVMRGYLGMDDVTKETLRGGWLHTGDLGYMDDEGFIFIVDRAKDMIISGGENVYSVEVENAVASHPSVAAVAVVGLPDEKMGEKVHAAIILNSGAELDLKDLQEHCRQTIAGYKIPRSMGVLDAFPMSGAGKVLKRDIRSELIKT